MLCAYNITKSNGGKPVLNDVSVCIAPGTATALMGPSGIGKSTLLRILASLDQPDSGYIKMDEVESTKINAGQYKPWPIVSMVFQDLLLWPHLTGLQNVLISMVKSNESEAMRLANQLMLRLRISDLANKYPKAMSRGEQQRFALVRALVLQPKYLLLDEATASLDSEHMILVSDILGEAVERGMGILAATHQVEFSQQLGGRVLRISSGCIV